jgi:hypothetical protein
VDELTTDLVISKGETMAQEYEDSRDCQTAENILREVKAEIARYTAKNLPDLQTELETFVKDQDTKVADYKSKFADLRKKWCARQVDVERLCAHVRCEFPMDRWRWLIEKCICKPLHDLCCLKRRIARRRYCCAGPYERKRDEAQWAFDKAAAHLTWMKDLAKLLDQQLDDNLTLVTQINAVPPEQRTAVLYLFYKLRRSHVHMAPYDCSEECKKVCWDFDPDKLCHEVFEHKCEDHDCNCVPKGEFPHYDCTCAEKIDGPWLMSPDKYRHELDCAWDAYHKAQRELAEAKAELTKHPDELASLIKKRDDDTTSLDDRIKTCLTEHVHHPSGDCCREHEPHHEHEPRREYEPKRESEHRHEREYEPEREREPRREYESEREPGREYEREGEREPRREYESEREREREPRREHEPEREPKREYESEREREPRREYEPEREREPRREHEPEREREPRRDYESRREYEPRREFEPKRDYDPKKGGK